MRTTQSTETLKDTQEGAASSDTLRFGCLQCKIIDQNTLQMERRAHLSLWLRSTALDLQWHARVKPTPTGKELADAGDSLVPESYSIISFAFAAASSVR